MSCVICEKAQIAPAKVLIFLDEQALNEQAKTLFEALVKRFEAQYLDDGVAYFSRDGVPFQIVVGHEGQALHYRATLGFWVTHCTGQVAVDEVTLLTIEGVENRYLRLSAVDALESVGVLWSECPLRGQDAKLHGTVISNLCQSAYFERNGCVISIPQTMSVELLTQCVEAMANRLLRRIDAAWAIQMNGQTI